jgi:hypothetical protein
MTSEVACEHGVSHQWREAFLSIEHHVEIFLELERLAVHVRYRHRDDRLTANWLGVGSSKVVTRSNRAVLQRATFST